MSSLACSIHKSLSQQLSGGRFDPQSMIPERYRVRAPKPKPKTPEQIAAENEAGWALLNRAFRGPGK